MEIENKDLTFAHELISSGPGDPEFLPMTQPDEVINPGNRLSVTKPEAAGDENKKC